MKTFILGICLLGQLTSQSQARLMWHQSPRDLVEGTPQECLGGPSGVMTVAEADGDYDKARHQWASQLGSEETADLLLHPTLILFCESEGDVVDAIAYAKQCGYKVSVRSGGHQYSGLSSCVKGTHCLQLDVSRLEHFTPPSAENDYQVTLGVGLRLWQVMDIVGATERVIPTGICTTVGVGGHYQSSALGFFLRSFGSGLDFVVGFRIVLGDGSIQTVTKESDPDLYWAVLGGNPGSWGVIIDYTLGTIASANYPGSNGLRLMWQWSPERFYALANKWVELLQLPEYERDFSGAIMVRPVDGAPQQGVFEHYIVLSLIYTGKDSGPWTALQYTDLVQPFKDIAMPILEQEPSPVGIPLHVLWRAFSTAYDHHGNYRYHENTMTDSNFSMGPEFMSLYAADLDQRMKIGDFYSDIQIFAMGGKEAGSQIFRNGVDGNSYKGNSYGGRNVKVFIDDWQFFKDSEMADNVAEGIRSFRNLAHQYFDTAGPDVEHLWMSTHTVDAVTDTSKFAWKDYYPDRQWLKRLQDVKAIVDPCNIFSHRMSVPLENKYGPDGQGAGNGKRANRICFD